MPQQPLPTFGTTAEPDDDDDYIAATWLETLVVIGLPVVFTTAGLMALRYAALALGVL